ncbi:ribokinase [Allomuricauda sp. SCSIO 65647]|uniref:ribokinase n=1 Tax=Allomuricauda sp. SCSIO 65647 TaxID=2908843 RepID=UPI001F451AA3|nr:ribokinase [Muricauda sp. SCSIO 65647]UJH67047.1 ribokinase [Muricauda sp. SCSIO 65647]
MKLVVVGSSNMDLVISVPKIPEIGETVLGGKSSMVFGGKGANQAVASIRSGGDVSYIAKVGDDLFGENMKTYFKNEGFRTELILTDASEPTGIAQIFVSEKGENSIAVASGANMKLMPKDIEPFTHLIKNSKVVLLQLETPLETVGYIASIAFQNNVKLILNPAPARRLNKDLLKRVWLITPNETEASILTGIKVEDLISAEKAAKDLLKKGVSNVIVTLGENGSLLCNKKSICHFPAFKTKSVDTTAAGDVFNGTLAVGITNDKSLPESISFATAAAALSVTKEGAQPSIPTNAEIDNFLKEREYSK